MKHLKEYNEFINEAADNNDTIKKQVLDFAEKNGNLHGKNYTHSF